MATITKAPLGKEDVSIEANTSDTTFTRTDSDGKTITLTKFPDVWKGSWVDMTTYLYPRNWSGVKIYDSGYVEIGTAASFYQTGYTTRTAAWDMHSYNQFYKVTDANHSGVLESALSIMYSPYGSGVESDPHDAPLASDSCDFGLHVCTAKQAWDTAPENGQVNGVCVVVYNGGQSDGGPYLGSLVVNSTQDGNGDYKAYGALFEGQNMFYRDNNTTDLVYSIGIYIASIQDFTGANGSYSSAGMSVVANTGTINMGHEIWGTSATAKFSSGLYEHGYVDIGVNLAGTHVYGLVASGTFSSHCALLSGTIAGDGISFYGATITGDGISFGGATIVGNAIDFSDVTLTGHVMVLPNNKSIYATKAGGGASNILYLSTSDQLVLGGELASGKMVMNIDGTPRVVTAGANGSGGTGYRMLLIPNA